MFVKMKPHRLRRMTIRPCRLTQGVARARHQIGSGRFAPQRSCFRAVDGKTVMIVRFGGNPVPERGKDRESLKEVIAVLTASGNMQRKIDLGRCVQALQRGHEGDRASVGNNRASARKPGMLVARSVLLKTAFLVGSGPIELGRT